MNNICCVTGHRDISEDTIQYVREKLLEEIRQAVQDGYKIFISGFADGVDLLFAECVLTLKEQYPTLFLEAAIPYANRLKSRNANMQELLKKCSGMKVVCEKYKPDCFMLRNRYMVQQASRVIAVYDNRDNGGTVATMRYASIMDKELRVIEIQNDNIQIMN